MARLKRASSMSGWVASAASSRAIASTGWPACFSRLAAAMGSVSVKQSDFSFHRSIDWRQTKGGQALKGEPIVPRWDRRGARNSALRVDDTAGPVRHGHLKD